MSRRVLSWVLWATAVLVVANWPVTTKQGVNREVTTHRLPLYAKAFEFLDRHAQYVQLAREVVGASSTDEQRLLAAYEFTRRRIRNPPDDWPIVDDHILNIVIRGYGQNDQIADVCALLATYSGVPAFWSKITPGGTHDGVILTFARVDDRWVVLDVDNGFLFRHRDGRLATPAEVAADPTTRPEGTTSMVIGSTPYSRILDQLRMPPIPRPLRAELQMPWPRLWYETKRAVGFEHDDGSER